VRLLGGETALSPAWQILITPGAEADSLAATMLLHDVRTQRGWVWRLRNADTADHPSNAIRLVRIPPGAGRDTFDKDADYSIDVLPGGILLQSRTDVGGYYALQTLRQLLRITPKSSLPRLHVADSPALLWRGVSDDISRGQLSTLDDFRATIQALGYYKINLYCIYIEDAFRFRADESIGRGRARLTPCELSAIVAEGRRNHVTVVPIFQVMGHQERLLANPSTRRYAEAQPRWAWVARSCDAIADVACSGSNVIVPGIPILLPLSSLAGAVLRAMANRLYAESAEPWSFSPVDPSALRFVQSLVHEIGQASKGPWLHIGGDEAVDIGSGTSRAEATRVGIGRVQGRYLQAQAQYVKASLHRRALCYSDLLLRGAGAAAELDTSLIVVDWHYDPADSFASVDTIRAMGFDNILTSCGLWNWRTFYPNYGRAFPNTANAAYAAKHGGLLGTVVASWGDGGAESLRGNNLPGYAYLAACTWQTDAPPESSFCTAFATSWWGPNGKPLGETIRLVGWQRFGELGWAGRLYYRPLDIRTRRPAWLAQMRRVEHDMSECEDRFDQAKRSGVPDDYLLACLRHACRRYAFVAGREITLSRIADETRTPSAGSKTAADLRGLTIEARALEAEYSVLWNLRNRPEGLDVPLARMHSQVTVLDSLALRFADRH